MLLGLCWNREVISLLIIHRPFQTPSWTTTHILKNLTVWCKHWSSGDITFWVRKLSSILIIIRLLSLTLNLWCKNNATSNGQLIFNGLTSSLSICGALLIEWHTSFFALWFWFCTCWRFVVFLMVVGKCYILLIHNLVLFGMLCVTLYKWIKPHSWTIS